MNENPLNSQTPPPAKRPNEQIGFHFSSSVKITDPQTGEVLVQMRAD